MPRYRGGSAPGGGWRVTRLVASYVKLCFAGCSDRGCVFCYYRFNFFLRSIAIIFADFG